MLLNHVGWKVKEKIKIIEDSNILQGTGKKAAVCANLAQQLRLAFGRGKTGSGEEDISASCLHMGIIQSCVGRIPPHIVQAMLTMLARGLNPADITQLAQANFNYIIIFK